MKDPESKLERIAYGARETAKHLLTVDDMVTYATTEGGLVVEFVRWNQKTRRPTESYRITLCPEDTLRLKREAAR